MRESQLRTRPTRIKIGLRNNTLANPSRNYSYYNAAKNYLGAMAINQASKYGKRALSRLSNVTYSPFKRKALAPSPNQVARKYRYAAKAKQWMVNKRNKGRMNMTGFYISRFLLMSFNNSNTSGTLRNAAGYVGKPFLKYQSQLDTDQALTIGAIPGKLTDIRTIVFCPTWPGSALGALNVEQINSKLPLFGLLAGNSLYDNPNYKWNTRAVKNVRFFGDTNQQELTDNNLKDLYNKIVVYKTFVSITLTNTDPLRPVEVYIVKFRYRKDQYFEGTTCKNVEGIADTWMKNLFTTPPDDQKKALMSYTFLNYLRKKKLPKLYKILSFKRVRLGALNIQKPNVFMSPGIQRNIDATKKVVMRFGSKTFYRNQCTQMDEMFQDQILKERYFAHTHVMIIPCYLEKDLTFNQAAEQTASVNVKIEKTNIWKEHNN